MAIHYVEGALLTGSAGFGFKSYAKRQKVPFFEVKNGAYTYLNHQRDTHFVPHVVLPIRC